MSDTVKRIWIDLDNSPHVPLFAPIIRHFRERGVEVFVTARQHSQTLELLELEGLGGTYHVVGRHHGKSKVKKLAGLLSRALGLAFVRKLDIAVAVSHGSRSMVLAALGAVRPIPVVTMYDYEFTETRLFNRLSNIVLVPDAIPDDVLDEIGVPKSKRQKYAGIKEELYVRSFRPDTEFRSRFLTSHDVGDPASKVLITLRPPATTANYHDAKGELLFGELLRFLNADDIVVVVVPRIAQQASIIEEHLAGVPDRRASYIVLREAVDGLQLTYASDLLISGGGTMNREAVLLGVPVYSIFAGRQGSLDRQMEADGRITFIRDPADFSKIKLVRRSIAEAPVLTDRIEKTVIEQIEAFL